MNVSSVPGSVRYRFVPCVERCLGGGSGIFLILFLDFWLADGLISHHFGLTH